MIQIDARGLACPKPTVLVKNEMDAGAEEIEVIVDNAVARDNIMRLAKNQCYECAVDEQDADIAIKLTKTGQQSAVLPVPGGSVVYLIKTATIGVGDDELGAVLMKGFIYALTEHEAPPSHIVLMNGGVRLAVEGSDHLENLKAISDKGCSILICGTCLDYFGLKDKVKVGMVSNMYDILDVVSRADNSVSI